MLSKLATAFMLLAATASAVTPFHYELNLNSTAFQQDFDDLVGDGYRLTYINGYTGESMETLFSAIWTRPKNTVPWISRLGLTGAEYDTLSAELKKKNYHPVVVNGYNVEEENGEARFATIWEKSTVGEWGQQRDLTYDQFKSSSSLISTAGYRLTSVSGYTVGKNGTDLRFAITWGKRTHEDWKGDWSSYTRETVIQFQRTVASRRSDGFEPIYLHVNVVDGEPMFHSIWQRHNLKTPNGYTLTNSAGTSSESVESYERSVNAWAKQGYLPTAVSAYYTEECGVQFAGTFVLE